MQKEYKVKTRNLYDPNSIEPYKVSRSGIELFIECPCCFYLNKRLGIGRPSIPPFTINKAVDTLLKKEFDLYRVNQTQHSIMKENDIDAVPFKHDQMDTWRANFKGAQYLHEPTNLLITGAVDDVWINKAGELIVVDYKATAKTEEVNIDADWQVSYKRQMEIYQWLFRQLGFKVSDTGYFLYCNGKTDKVGLNGKLEFDISILPHKGDGGWIEGTILSIKKCLDNSKAPELNNSCEFCGYAKARAEIK